MSEIVLAQDLYIDEVHAPISFCLVAGSMSIILTPKDEINCILARTLLRLETARSGSLCLFGRDILALPVRTLHEMRRRTGLVYGSGGLISNLKVWENLTLPLYYHQNLTHAEIESKGRSALDRIGFTGNLMELPGHLSFSDRKFLGLARAMIINPELMIYESPFLGLNQDERSRYIAIAKDFHLEKPGRASLVISSSHDVAKSLSNADLISI
jgi:phospholipid/cholesterol/gamma-HCH transport system ATP-binding protein